MKKKSIIIITSVILFLVLGAGLYAYYAFNRTNKQLNDIKPAYILSTETLTNEFAKDATAAETKYVDKAIEVTGTVKIIETNDKGKITIVLGDSSSLSSLRFSMDSTVSTETNTIKVSSNIRLRGMCTGYNADDMGLGSDILFNRAVIIENKK